MSHTRKLIATISRYNMDGCLLETYPNARIAAEAMKSSQAYISYAARNKRALTACGYLWRRGSDEHIDVSKLLNTRWLGSSPLAKKQLTVGQYDLKGNFIGCYTNTKTAGAAVGLHYQGIRKVIRGELLTYGGFIWNKKTRKKIKFDARIEHDTSVSQYDLDGRWLRSYKNAYTAGNITGIDDSSISHCINGRVLTAGSCIWRNGALLRINVYKLRKHTKFSGSVLERHLNLKRRLKRA